MTLFEKRNLRTLVVALASALALATASPASAQDFPNREIKVIITYAAGGPTDLIGRLIAEHMGRVLGQRMVVENRAGANGATATRSVARGDKDGYTILLNASNHGTNIIGMKEPGYTWDDFTVVGGISYSPFTMMTNTTSTKAKTLKELVAFAKANPGKLKFASLGPQSLNNLLPQRLGMVANIDWQEVPYRSGAQVVPDLLNSTVDVYFGLLSTGVAVFGRPDIEVMGTSESTRSKLLPTVPTFAEQGFPEINDYSVNGFWVPVGTPKPVVDKLRAALEQAKKSPEFQAAVEKTGNLIFTEDHEKFDALMRKLTDQVAGDFKRLGIQPE
jgi:tripartite-type tricarboxylate transporter receptor subunit TctC